ncbi:hypothetical protein [Halosimplex halophilum]|uniref:hypothetical protein n=1 Tax=Halosimplex halophilum TaxID=2559572 RepID=UPI00107F7380|nr:hypothetical protein [Halosimplex halophilum]
MADATSRAVAALTDVVAVEREAPGMVSVVSVSDEYVVDVRGERCECPDMQYHLEGEGRCKHIHAARIATGVVDVPGIDLADNLDEGPKPLPDFEDFDPEGEYVV